MSMTVMELTDIWRQMEKGDPEMKLLLGAEPPANAMHEVDGVNSSHWKK